MISSVPAPGPRTDIKLQVTGMTCASCVMRVELTAFGSERWAAK